MHLLLVFLAATLSDYMPFDVQQRTGVTSLTRQQQNELANWLASYMEPTQNPAQKRLTLAENYHGGRVLQLSDGSIWEVAPSEINYTGLWVTPFPVMISESTDPRYPYKLTNMVTGTSVHVRRIYTVNPPDIPKEPPVEHDNQPPAFPQPQQKPPPSPKLAPKPAPKPEQQPTPSRIIPNQDQLPGMTPGPNQGGPPPTPPTK